MTPNGDLLIEDLSFEVKSGVNVVICGPNGCGKSSLFRTLGEVSQHKIICGIHIKFITIYMEAKFIHSLKLWPLFGGTITKPEKGKLFYVPQVSFVEIISQRIKWIS